MKDLACTTGISPGKDFEKNIQKLCGSVTKSSFLIDTSSTYAPIKNRIEWTINNYYYIQNTPPLFENLKMEDDRLLAKKEIADFLNLSIKMIDRKVSLNEIPFLKIGKLVRFNKEEVLRWAKENNPKRK